jgi:hypothetical protein
MGTGNFQRRVDKLKESRLTAADYATRDIALSRFQKSWQPLIDHLQTLVNELADKNILPFSARLNVVTETKDKKLQLDLILQKDRLAENPGPDYASLDNPDNEHLRWEELARISYYTGPGAYDRPGKMALLMGRCTLRDLFRKNANNIHALIHLSGDEAGMKNSTLHPDRMDAAKIAIEKWLVRQVAYNFEDPTSQSHQSPLSPAPKPLK